MSPPSPPMLSFILTLIWFGTPDVLSSATVAVSFCAVGVSFTGITVIVIVAVEVSPSISVIVYVKLSVPL